MGLRRKGLARFGENAIRRGIPLATLEEAFVPLYLCHRYQVQAAAHALAGVRYRYSMRGDGLEPSRPVPAAEQTRALSALILTLDPAALAVPESVLKILPPRPYSYDLTSELFGRHTGRVFDALSPAMAAADLTLSSLMDPSRAARLVQQHALDPRLPGLESVLGRIISATFDRVSKTAYEAEIARTVRQIVVSRLMNLLVDFDSPEKARLPHVRAVAALKLDELRQRAEKLSRESDEADRASFVLMATDIRRFQSRQYDPKRIPAPLSVPAGPPLGAQAF
jgi:hypothetical protein